MGETARNLLEMRGISKSFGSTKALDRVDFSVQRGEVHALVGENGAGKSTLMKILSGALEPDAGTIDLDGRAYRPASPIEGRRAGVAMIYQELNLAPQLTVEANVMLGIEEKRFGVWLERGRMKDRVRQTLDRLEHPEIDPDTRVIDLGVGAQQIVEVARALMSDARLVVMDEPTSSLSRQDTQQLFQVITSLKERGVGVIYISHFLEEVRRVADRFTVLRDGKTVGSGTVADSPTEKIIHMMVGRQLDQMFPRIPHDVGAPVLELRKIRGDPLPLSVDLNLRRGEILGVAGLVGAGRTETVRGVFGLDRLVGGTVTSMRNTGFRGPNGGGTGSVVKRCDGGATPWERICQGFGLLSEDRKEEGLAQNLSLADNVTLSRLHGYAHYGVLCLSSIKTACDEWITRLGIRARGWDQSVDGLSGGNQQKVALARLLHQGADIMLLDEPTRGIDVGSKVAVYELIGELAKQGKAILYISSYLPELFGIADRIAVMHRGRLVAVKNTEEWTEESIMAFCVGEDGGENR